jgi:hypothetical protein
MTEGKKAGANDVESLKIKVIDSQQFANGRRERGLAFFSNLVDRVLI